MGVTGTAIGIIKNHRILRDERRYPIQGKMLLLPLPSMYVRLDETAETEILLDDDVCEGIN